MKRFFALTAALIVAGFLMTGCGKDPVAPMDSDAMNSKNVAITAATTKDATKAAATAYTCNAVGEMVGYQGDCPSVGMYEYKLWAGKHNDAGVVRIWTDNTNLYVQYDTNETADLLEAHVYVWTSLSQIPTKRPAPGQAPYKATINADSYTFVIPLSKYFSDPCGHTFYISTHAALTGDAQSGSQQNAGQTAYSGDSTCFDGTTGGAWWGFVTFNVECYYEVSGYVYNDANNSGNNESEAGFAGLTVTATGGSAVTTTTNASGYYSFMLRANGVYVITTQAPAGDYLAKENAGGFNTGSLTKCIENADFGFVPLYDIFVNVNLSVTCYENVVVTINGNTITSVNGVYSLENQLPATSYVVVVTAYDANGNVLATSSQTISSLNENTTLTFNLSWNCLPPTPPTTTCETAFAFGNNQDNCFLNYGFNRWGWVIPTTVGSTTYDVYAGAGLCDLSKGTLVGTVTINYNGSQVTVTYNMLSGYTMDEAHVYAGSAMFPQKNGVDTVAPGQYTVVSDLTNATTATYTISGLSGDIYVIAHGVVCGSF